MSLTEKDSYSLIHDEQAQKLFESKYVIKPDGHWRWMGPKMIQGHADNTHGSFHYGGKSTGAHRVAMTLYLRRHITKNEQVCHYCSYNDCVNPDHLYVEAYYAKSTERKLTEKQAFDLIWAYHAENMPPEKLADTYGISLGHVLQVVRGVYHRKQFDEVRRMLLNTCRKMRFVPRWEERRAQGVH